MSALYDALKAIAEFEPSRIVPEPHDRQTAQFAKRIAKEAIAAHDAAPAPVVWSDAGEADGWITIGSIARTPGEESDGA